MSQSLSSVEGIDKLNIISGERSSGLIPAIPQTTIVIVLNSYNVY